MRKIFLLTSFFTATPALLIITLIFLSFLNFQQKHNGILINFNKKDTISFAALPSLDNRFEHNIVKKDAREEIVRQFFSKYQSPLEPFAKDVISAADNYDIDFRLLPAIAMQESNLCKKAPVNSYNCWGFGIYGGKITRFDNYPQAINTVTKTLAKEYKDKGLQTPQEIVSKYTPSDNGKWVRAVTQFMDYLQ